MHGTLCDVSELSSVNHRRLAYKSFSFHVFVEGSGSSSGSFVIRHIAGNKKVRPTVIVVIKSNQSASAVFVFQEIVFQESGSECCVFYIGILILRTRIFKNERQAGSARTFSHHHDVQVVVIVIVYKDSFRPGHCCQVGIVALNSFELPVLSLLIECQRAGVSTSCDEHVYSSVVVEVTPDGISRL